MDTNTSGWGRGLRGEGPLEPPSSPACAPLSLSKASSGRRGARGRGAWVADASSPFPGPCVRSRGAGGRPRPRASSVAVRVRGGVPGPAVTRACVLSAECRVVKSTSYTKIASSSRRGAAKSPGPSRRSKSPASTSSGKATRGAGGHTAPGTQGWRRVPQCPLAAVILERGSVAPGRTRGL